MDTLKHSYFTSYYANYRNVPKDFLCVGISRIIPNYFKDSQFENFIWSKDNFMAPSLELLLDKKNGKISEEEYSKRYITELTSRVNLYTGFSDLSEWFQAFDNNLSQNQTEWKSVVFMCYEKPTEFCHRHILRKVLNNYYHILIEELNLVKEGKVKTTLSLF